MNPTDLNFKISTTAELSALRETERELIKSVTAAKALGKGDDVKKFGDQLAGVQARLAQFSPGQKMGAEVASLASRVPVLGTALDALGGALTPVSAGLAVAAAGLAAAKKGIDAYADQETDIVKLNQALANSGQFSAQASEAVQELANRWKDLTDIDDSKFLGVSRVLLQFGARTADLDRYTETVVNLAGIMGGDLNAAANLFGKALQGNTDVVGRYGIKVDAAASQTEKLDSIMRQAAARGAGQLTAGSETLNRQFASLRLGVDDAVKGFGNLIARTGVVQVGLDVLRGGVLLLNKLLPSTANVAGDFSNKLGQIGDNAEEAARKLDAAKKAGEDLAAVDLAKLDQQALEAERAFARLTAQIRASEQAKIALTDAQLARDLAGIDDQEATGQLSASGAADARFKAKAAAEEEKTRLQLASIAAQKKEAQDRAALATADVARREAQLGNLAATGATAGGTAQSAERGIVNGRIGKTKEDETRAQELAALREQLARALGANRYNGEEATKLATDPILQQISALEAEGKKSDESFAAEQKRLAEQLAAASAEAARIKAEIEKLKPELEKAKANAEQVGKDARARIGELDIQDTTIRATAPIKQETAAIQNREAARTAAEKDRQQQQADDAAAVERGLLTNADTLAKRAEPGVKAVGRAAAKAGDSALFTAAKQAQEAIDATRDGTSEEEAQAALAALQGLTKALEQSNQRSATLEKLVATFASQLKALETAQATARDRN